MQVDDHPSINGVKQITYKMPAYDGKSPEPVGWREKEFSKTVYDPKVIPNEQMLEWGREAVKEAQEAGRLQTLPGLADNKNIPIMGYSKNGLKFLIYIDNQGLIHNFHPVLD